MKKRYVLLTKTLSKYDGMERYNYKLFNDYFELQRHLQNYWFVEKNRYVIFVIINTLTNSRIKSC